MAPPAPEDDEEGNQHVRDDDERPSD
jgi:hypothetical protein